MAGTRNTGQMQGVFKDLASMITQGSRNNQRLELLSGERYYTSNTDDGSGIILSTGNYANPVPVGISDAPSDGTPYSRQDLGWVSANLDVPNDQNSASYTLLPTDHGKTVTMTSASANTVTIDANSNQNILVNSVILINQRGSGATTILAVAGVTLNGVDGGSVTIDAQWKSAAVKQYSIDAWQIEGAIGDVA